MSHLIKVYHNYDKWKKYFEDFLEIASKTLSKNKFAFGLHYEKWEIFYSFSSNQKTYSTFESQFYSHFNNFQIINDTKDIRAFDNFDVINDKISIK